MSPGPLMLLATALLSISLAYGQNEEVRLIKKLLEKYPVEGGRPAANATDAIDVQLKLNLLHIDSLDQDKKVFAITAWLYQQWTDSFLKWEPSDFAGLDYVLLDLSLIWRPDITLFNAIDKPQLLQTVMAHVTSTGTVIIVEPYKLVTQCPEVTPEKKKPSCSLKFGSWAYDTTRLTVTNMESMVDITYFQSSNEYELLGSEIEAEEKIYPCCPGISYGHVAFTIELEKRKKKPEVDPNASSATTSFTTATTVAALVALQMALRPLL